ncbi:hypothetical protein PT249_02205 [Erysipelothrix rhusiopathiae]|nr:hypothetical protein [Erysipelothrix rhusiopathiae]
MTEKKSISFLFIFLGFALSGFGGSTLGSFIITDVIFYRVLNIQGNLETVDLIARISLIAFGFLISGIGVLLFRKSNKH